jgi:predicted MPP superfamily phosphohydrolase
LNEIRDFSKVKNFPGTLDNEFDLVLRRFENLEKIPSLLFAALLALIAVLAGYGRWTFSLALWTFLLVDWLLLSQLPRMGVSYGPAKPPALILAIMRIPFALLPSPAALVFQGIGTLLVLYGFWIEPHRLTISRQRLETSKLPSGISYSLLHLGDLHVERTTKREQNLTRAIQDLRPDLILFSGDILNLSYVEDPTAIDHARQLMRQWSAPLGVFGVAGSEAVDLAHIYPDLVNNLPMRWLRADVVPINVKGVSISVTGMTCSHRPFRDFPILQSLSTQRAGEFSIFLYHSPDLAPEAATLGYDLQLSGHTHGGQVCLPFYGPLFTASLYGRRFQSGRYLIEKMVLYITRGIGLEGKAAPRIRFLCPPEIIYWEIIGTGVAQENTPKE